jgi:hypothetical protein
MKNLFSIFAAVIVIIIVSSAVAYILIKNNQNKETYEDIQQDIVLLKQQVKDDLKEFKMIKRIKSNRGLLKSKDDFKQISQYQKYVTPDNQILQNYISTNQITTANKAYNTAKQWIWVSDQTLHGTTEKWLLPQEFIQDSPIDPDNPVQGNMASDCESQAYTLVSILEALGTAKTNVRVIVGYVNFSGSFGGHAWVQVYENNDWFELEATSGPYWDDDDNKLVNSIGFSYNYFKTHPYPVEEYWAYFNDRFYYNPTNGQKSIDLPNHWL